ncbi:YbeD family protein [Hydrogenovibrio marinus]|uniref:UPF0250 protein EI16_09760 n=1 Tax=Hydrogenovibrio marinus TaxID=28885 RepID=A0A066ZW73_HYDMR|nr:DUF493 domain-containing protein [Hydrogenovibrio marinus]KDN96534.1 hypothetical protein EI16_09760 [Hydrogenovibrio marinus]BBN60261.1 UPF0250 protein [Hydrogenovibrio marinus]
MTVDLHTPDNESLIEFPCDYQLKAMGRTSETFIDTVFEITKKHAPDVTRENIHLKDSKASHFVSVNITFHATSLAQLHAIYGELKQHPEVLMTL